MSRCSVATAPDYDLSTPPELDVDRAEPTGEYQIVLPDGRPLHRHPGHRPRTLSALPHRRQLVSAPVDDIPR
jgi:hypothetical protein